MTDYNDFDEDEYPAIAAERRQRALIAANDAFVAAMTRAVKKKRERATFGTFVDVSSTGRAVRIRGDVTLSGCGSPAAMCAESGV